MKPGEVRTFQRGKGNAAVVSVGVWAKKPTKNGPIHIHLAGIAGGQTTVTNRPGGARYHRTLFRDLRKLLIALNCWPFGSEGSETEQQS